MAKKKEKPLTREDVLRLIEEHGGPKGLDLSKRSLEGANLSELDLSGIVLAKAKLSRANLRKSNLQSVSFQGTSLGGANFQQALLNNCNLQGAKCGSANFKEAVLSDIDLRGAVLCGSSFKGATLSNIKVRQDTDLFNVDWGPNYVLAPGDSGGRTYRNLKNWYHDAGLYHVAGEFYFREMESRRKAIHLGPPRSPVYTWDEKTRKFVRERGTWVKPAVSSWEQAPLIEKVGQLLKQAVNWVWLTIVGGLCGYGEKPSRVVISAAVIILGLAAAYFLWGSLSGSSFWDSLYYSAVSFTALGYGSWAPQPTGWVKGLGAFEAFMGVFMMALFLVTLTRKMTR